MTNLPRSSLQQEFTGSKLSTEWLILNGGSLKSPILPSLNDIRDGIIEEAKK